jgi:hypothetical protein
MEGEVMSKRRYLWPMVGLFLLVAAVCWWLSPEQTSPSVVQHFRLTDEHGVTLRAVRAEADRGTTIRIEFVPNSSVEEVSGRVVQPAALWCWVWKVYDQTGNLVRPKRPPRFEHYDVLASLHVLDQELNSGDGQVVWISPEPPGDPPEGGHQLYAALMLPDEPGEYRLSIEAYPTADPWWSGRSGIIGGKPEYGAAVRIDSVSLSLAPPTSGVSWSKLAYRTHVDRRPLDRRLRRADLSKSMLQTK